ncbi:MAG: hypothetical protein GIKADHBN_00782 [Phycisphaerales bacterium]|nr:hypothetical protein [Phycisphaerales bacterium]
MTRPLVRFQLADRSEAPGRVEPILRSVPEWFGIEQATLSYVAAAGRLATWFAICDDQDAGFVTVQRHFDKAADLFCMAVHRRFHGMGVGTALVRHVEGVLREQGVEYLQVKTQGPSKPNAGYARTLHFYEKVGFVRLEEVTGLWPGIPCLILVKRL